MHILIAGGGIGGLTAALCLLKSGHNVTVFEQSSHLSEVGAGLQCGANALYVFDYLGLLNDIEAIAVAPQSIEFRDYQDAKRLYRIELGEHYRQRYGLPYYHVHRADLQQILSQALSQHAESQLELNASVTEYSESSQGVSVTLADSRLFHGDCLIGADGIRSNVRQKLLGSCQPRFTGHVAWRGLVPVDRLPDKFMETVTTNFVGHNKHFVIYYLRNQKLVNFVGVVENKQWKNDSWTQSAPWNELKNDFSGWHPTVQTLIDATERESCYRWALYDHKPFKNWSSDRVTLLGDAAHPTLPFMASGAAMAIEDARVLQRAIDQSESIKEGLHLYQRNRIARTGLIQTRSSKMGMLYHVKNRFLRQAAFAALGLISGKKENFLPDYNANSVRLV